MNIERDILKAAIDAEANDRIECPVCGEEIPAFELATDHAHPKELLNTILDLLPELEDDRSSQDHERDVCKGFGVMNDVDGFREAVERDLDHGDGAGKLRETIIRYDPERVTRDETRRRLQLIENSETEEEIPSFPERRVFSVGDEADYERISEAALGVANAFVGSSLYAGHDRVSCPDCGYGGSVNQAVWPEGTDHCSDAETEEKDDG